MTSNEIRQKFLEFFEKRGHKIVPSSSLIPDDPSVLLTTAGMQQFKPYYTGKADAMKDFGSLNAASVQKSFRTSDIDEVGDESHLTFFEMLGNFSFGGYFKKEAIQYAYDFLKELELPIEFVTVFGGDTEVPADEESEKIWRNLGVTDIRRKGREDNFWGPTGSDGPCGPTTEIYVNGVEIWNIVFNQYYCKSDKTLVALEKSGVDTGMGLERLAMVLQNKKNIFETDLFSPFALFLVGNPSCEREGRVIADHMRAIVFLLADGVLPLNKGAGYILRRLIRRTMMQTRRLGFSEKKLPELVDRIVEYYKFYPELENNRNDIKRELTLELEKFEKTLASGIKEFFSRFPEMVTQEVIPGKPSATHKIKKISGDDAFYFHQSHGLTLDVIKDLARLGGHIVEVNEREFEQAVKKHQEISRAGIEKKFGGHGLLLDTGELKAANEEELQKVTRLHTATHLLNAALRMVLQDENIRQNGSDITAERARFDFSFPRKLTPEEINKIEDAVNEVVAKNMEVTREEMPYADAVKSGALHFFREKYPERVSVYAVRDSKTGEVFSKELCGGPHVSRTGEIGRFKIIKEESSSAGVRRIRATLLDK
jgi:alanyl-tRNA synthetase